MMASRTVVAIEPSFEDALIMRLSKAPVNIAGARKPFVFNCNPDAMPPWDEAAAVKLHGQKLFNELETHPAVNEALQNILNAAPGQTHSVYFHLMVEAAEQLCWETLCRGDGEFLAFDPRWAIARIADSVVDRHMPLYNFTPPLKVAALMSALHRDAAPEWQGLKASIEKSRAKGLNVELLVLVGQQELLESIESDIANGLQGVTVAPIPDRTVDLEETLSNNFRPQILHFFCHGSASHGVARLELATILDWIDDENKISSLRLQVRDLLGMPALEDTWLVTLNCCEGGKVTDNMHSMAHSLVANGVPAAVGVLEPLEVGDAHEFCAGFYPAVFEKLRRLIVEAPADASVELEWAATLRGARKSLCEKHGNDPINNRTWALPVLYVRPEVFCLKVLPDVVDQETLHAYKSRAEEVAGSLAALPPDAPVEFREALLELLDDIPESMRPDLQGNFKQN